MKLFLIGICFYLSLSSVIKSNEEKTINYKKAQISNTLKSDLEKSSKIQKIEKLNSEVKIQTKDKKLEIKSDEKEPEMVAVTTIRPEKISPQIASTKTIIQSPSPVNIARVVPAQNSAIPVQNLAIPVQNSAIPIQNSVVYENKAPTIIVEIF